jgi:hypothetical protein
MVSHWQTPESGTIFSFLPPDRGASNRVPLGTALVVSNGHAVQISTNMPALAGWNDLPDGRSD